jgi:type 1 glutamine amidotransferase
MSPPGDIPAEPFSDLASGISQMTASVVSSSEAIAWYHDFDGGRAFYTALGHTPESFVEPLFLQHLLGGIEYAAGAARSGGKWSGERHVEPPRPGR